MKEVKLLKQMTHPQVVQLIASFLKEKEHSVWIVMEYCLGSVSDCVEGTQGRLSIKLVDGL